jgi:hypothetical protein
VSLLTDVLTATKKIVLVGDELDRLSDDVRELSHAVADHEGRLIRIETMIEMAQRNPKLPRK